MKLHTLNELVGKEVKIYPNDTLSKQGVIHDISAHGILFKITQSKCKNYKVGSLHFIGIASQVSFAVI